MVARKRLALPPMESDGDERVWKSYSDYQPIDKATVYHEKLADLFMARNKTAVQGESYIFDRLPAGYKVFNKLRSTGGSDRYLIGHKSHIFRSPNEFAPHFDWLLSKQTGTCKCKYCSPMKSSTKVPKSSDGEAQKKTSRGRARNFEESKVATEGIAGGIRAHFLRIARTGAFVYDSEPKSIEETLRLPESQYYVEKTEKTFQDISRKSRSMPRVGEIVLFRQGGDLRLHSDGNFKVCTDDGVLEAPTWRAGVVQEITYTRCSDGEDAGDNPSAWLKSGSTKAPELKILFPIIIELRDDPKSNDSYTYPTQWHVQKLEMHRVRPFFTFKDLLPGNQEEWHLSIKWAASLSTYFCLSGAALHCMRSGEQLSFSCGGLWIGPELIIRGDVVRLLSGEDSVTSVLYVHKVVVSLSGQVSNPFKAEMYGNAFSTHFLDGTTTATSLTPEETAECLPLCMRSRSWFPHKGYVAISIANILGRYYDEQTMSHLVASKSIDVGREGMVALRKWSNQQKHRYAKGVTASGWAIKLDRATILKVDPSDGKDVSQFGSHIVGLAEMERLAKAKKSPRSKVSSSKLAEDAEKVASKTILPELAPSGSSSARAQEQTVQAQPPQQVNQTRILGKEVKEKASKRSVAEEDSSDSDDSDDSADSADIPSRIASISIVSGRSTASNRLDIGNFIAAMGDEEADGKENIDGEMADA